MPDDVGITVDDTSAPARQRPELLCEEVDVIRRGLVREEDQLVIRLLPPRWCRTAASCLTAGRGARRATCSRPRWRATSGRQSTPRYYAP
eukprot:scaffold57706_cov82-Phaeocystis_antarctica.AAC.10